MTVFVTEYMGVNYDLADYYLRYLSGGRCSDRSTGCKRP